MKPKGIAARAGRWSAEHRFKAIGIWLVFVALAVFVGGAVGTETLSDEEYGVGESQRADKALADGFNDAADETVLIQGDDVESPEFRAAVDQLVTELEANRERHRGREPLRRPHRDRRERPGSAPHLRGSRAA